MPKYKFLCSSCGSEKTQYCSSSVDIIVCAACQADMTRQFPNISGETEVNEVIDPLTNKKWQQDQKELLKARRDQHYWEVDVPRLVRTHSIETSLEQGWLVYNDKGELVVNKPPSKR